MTQDSVPESPLPTLSHFTTYRLTPAFWSLEADDRRTRASAWLRDMRAAAESTELYLTQGFEAGSDVLVWQSVPLTDSKRPADFFTARATAESGHRDIVDPRDTLWGLTRPSQYSKARSAQEIDPFADARTPYLVMYPFTKSADWYLLGRETRQGMMNEHIRIGKQFVEIKQLLLYSFGLQDQEFVVVYETEDLELFSKLVYDLRDTEARRYTKADTPLHTGVHMTFEQWISSVVTGAAS